MNYDDIGKFIQEKRKEKGLTQKELASKIGVTDKAVSKWETGLGCPDISILEVLSECLGCSILELLKGREIEGKVIPVTEADDYIKDSLKYGENNFKRVISKIIAFIVIFIVIALFILNIVNINNQRKKYPYAMDNYTRITDKIDIIYENIDTIEKNQGRYSKEDYDTLISLLHNTKENIEMNPYINFTGRKLTMSDLYIMDISGLSYTDYFAIYRILSKYDNNMESKLASDVESVASRMFLGSPMVQETYDSIYKYQISYDNEYDYGNPSTKVQAREYDIIYRLGLYADITNAIIEVGDIHE